MFIVRFLILAFLVAYGWGMAQTPPSDLNGFGKFISASFFITAPVFYFLPTIEASLNARPNISQIAIINAFLGWTGIGWIVALVMAFSAKDKPAPKPAPNMVYDEKSGGYREVQLPPSQPETKKCPFCAEEVRFEAIKCKHCGSDLKPAEPPAPA